MSQGRVCESPAPESNANTSGQMFYRGRSEIEIKKNVLIVESVKLWRSLPHEVAASPLLDIFKKRLTCRLCEGL